MSLALATPSALRSATWAWVLDWDYGGTVWRLASREDVAVPPADVRNGTDAVPYVVGLDVGDAEEDLTLFAPVPDARSMAVSILPPAGMDVAALTASGHVPTESLADLRLVGMLASGEVVCLYRVRGHASEVRSGVADQMVTFTVAEADADDAATLLPESACITETTWPSADPEVLGVWYPIVLGRPGSSEFFGRVGRGSPAYAVDVSGGTVDIQYLLSYGHVSASTVHLYCEDTHSTADLSVTNGVDGLGQPVATVTDAGNALGWTDGGISVWVSWDDGDGLVGVRRLGEVVRWALRQSTLTVDWGSLGPVLPILDMLGAVDTPITMVGDRISPCEWLRDQVLPLLPVSATWTPDGYSLRLWRPDALATQAVARLSIQEVSDGVLSAGDVVRTGDVSWGDVAEVKNDIVVSYAFNQPRNLYYSRARLTGDPTDRVLDSEAGSGLRLRRSAMAYGRRPLSLSTQAAWDPGTAGMWLTWQAEALAHPARVVEVEGGPEHGALSLGDIVTVSSTALSWDGLVGSIIGRTLSESGRVALRIRIETP